MKVLKIRAYDYNELNEAGKTAVKHWLDEAPIEVENDKGEFEFRYFSDMTDIEIDEHCQANDYLFTESGRPIHHLERVEA